MLYVLIKQGRQSAAFIEYTKRSINYLFLVHKVLKSDNFTHSSLEHRILVLALRAPGYSLIFTLKITIRLTYMQLDNRKEANTNTNFSSHPELHWTVEGKGSSDRKALRDF